MTVQGREYATYIPKAVIAGTGVLTLLSSAYGLSLSFESLTRAIRGEFPEVARQLAYFYPAFYLMLGVTIVSCLVLGWCGLDQVRLRLTRLKLFVGLTVFEMLYFGLIGGFLWNSVTVGTSVGAATGVANQGMMPQFRILLPLWAPFTLVWAKKRLTNAIAHPTEALLSEAAGRGRASSANSMRRKFLTALVAGVGGGISFSLVLSVAMSFALLEKHMSAFAFYMVAFFLGGVCAIYAATLDSPMALRIRGRHYTAVVLVIFASYFAASLWLYYHRSVFSFFPMAFIIGIILNGFSLRAVRNCLWAFAGSVLGVVSLSFALWAMSGSVFGIMSIADVKRILDYPLVLHIRHGVLWYGFGLGLLLSQQPPREKT
jgi:hypothetical protein